MRPPEKERETEKARETKKTRERERETRTDDGREGKMERKEKEKKA